MTMIGTNHSSFGLMVALNVFTKLRNAMMLDRSFMERVPISLILHVDVIIPMDLILSSNLEILVFVCHRLKIVHVT